MNYTYIIQPPQNSINYRYDIINYFIKKYNYTEYLEIGVAHGENLRMVIAKNKTSVDPNPQIPITHPMTSDQFFEQNTKKFDIIFIDGLHIDRQVDLDIENSLKCLNDNGTIILHDCNPPTENHGKEEWILSDWNGTVWKSIVKKRCTDPNITINVVNVDWGCGIIRKGHQEPYKNSSIETCLTWPYFERNKNELLNLISPENFVNIY